MHRPAYLLESTLLDLPLVEDEEEEGGFDYSVTEPSEVYWDSEPELDAEGLTTLYCDRKHAWQTVFVNDPPDGEPKRG